MEFPALNMSFEPQVERFFDPASNAICFIVKDPASQALASPGQTPACMVDVIWAVASFQERAVAYHGKNTKSQMPVTRGEPHPVVGLDSGFSVDAAETAAMQQRAHRFCLVANSPADSVEVNIL